MLGQTILWDEVNRYRPQVNRRRPWARFFPKPLRSWTVCLFDTGSTGFSYIEFVTDFSMHL